MNAEDRYDSLFQFYGATYGVDWKLLKAQVKQESNFNPNAVSKVGAKGLAQFMDRTFAEWEDGTPGIQPPQHAYNPFDPEDCIKAQASYMHWLIDYFSGDVELALAAYNLGPGGVKKLAVDGKTFEDIAGSLPDETAMYVPKIMGSCKQYQSG